MDVRGADYRPAALTRRVEAGVGGHTTDAEAATRWISARLGFAAVLWIIRHAAALDRYLYDGPDVERPLNDWGRTQADALAGIEELRQANELYSSPAVRCTQTLAPLAHATSLEIVEHRALGEGSSAADALALVRTLTGTDAVLCSHGDVIPMLIGELTADGMTIVGSRGCEKASIWRLEVSGSDIVRGQYQPPLDQIRPTN